MEERRMPDGRIPSSATGRGHEVSPERASRLDALEREYRQWRAVARGTIDVHGTVPGSGTMRRAGRVFAMRPGTGCGMTYED